MKKQITSIAVHITVMCIFIGMNRFHAIAQEQHDSVLVNSIGGFTRNMGQLLNTERAIAEDVLYYSGSGEWNTYLMKDKVAFVFSQVINQEDEDSLFRFDMMYYNNKEEPDSIWENDQLYYKNFYLAHTGSGIDSVGVYREVNYRNLVDGFDIQFSMINGIHFNFSYDASANRSEDLLIYFEGNDSIVYDDGTIKVISPAQKLMFDSLLVYQMINDTMKVIEY